MLYGRRIHDQDRYNVRKSVAIGNIIYVLFYDWQVRNGRFR